MLKSVSIKNFKSCGDVELSNLTNITALIGRNSTGKTNILTAIQWAAKSAVSADNVDREFVGLPDQKLEFVFSIELNGRQYRYTLAAAFGTYDEESSGESDPITEADVFYAYGKYEAAEMLIKEAIQNTPDRLDLRYKLLDIYHGAKNKEMFAHEAAVLAAMVVDKQDPQWLKVLDMGREMAPASKSGTAGSGAAGGTTTAVVGLAAHNTQAAKVEFEFSTKLDELLEIINDSDSETLISRKAGELTVQGWDSVINIEQDVPCLRAITKLLPKSPVVNDIALIIGFLEGINYYPFHDLESRGNKYGAPALDAPPLEHSDYINWLSKYRRSSEPADSIKMRLLHMYLESREDFDEVVSLLGPKGLAIISNIRIDSIEMPRSEKGAVEPKDQSRTLYFFEFFPFYSDSSRGVSSRYYGFSNLSFGTRRLISMVVSLIFDRSTVMLLEQPEDGIHPGLLHKVIPLLRSYSENAQVLLASHSPEVLNRLEPKEIRLVTMKNGFTNVRELNNNELSGVRSYINDEGTLADFLDSIQED